MLDKLLDELHFSNLESDLKARSEQYPNFLILMSGESLGSEKLRHAGMVRRLLSFPENDVRLRKSNNRRIAESIFNRHEVTLSQVTTWCKENLEAIKMSYLIKIDYLMINDGWFVPEELRLRHSGLSRCNDIRIIHDFYINVQTSAQKNYVRYDFSTEEGLSWPNFKERVSCIGEMLSEIMYREKKQGGDLLSSLRHYLIIPRPATPISQEELDHICRDIDLRSLKKDLVKLALKHLSRDHPNLLYKSKWIIEEKNLDKIMELIISL